MYITFLENKRNLEIYTSGFLKQREDKKTKQTQLKKKIQSINDLNTDLIKIINRYLIN